MLTLQVLATHHGMFARQILILRAGAEPFTEDDEARLEVPPPLQHLPAALSLLIAEVIEGHPGLCRN